MLAVAGNLSAIGVSAPGATQSGDLDAVQPRLARAAEDFEAQMMKELLKPMTSGNGLTGPEDDEEGSGGALGEFACEALGRALSAQGGFGIATRIERELSHSGTLPATAKGTRTRQFSPGISGRK